MKERKVETGEKCQKCGNFNATHLVDIHAAVTILAKLCTRCTHKTLAKHPASSAVYIRRYE